MMPDREKTNIKPFATLITGMLRVAVVVIASSTGAYGQVLPQRMLTAPKPTTIIERIGLPMSEADARHGIGFWPFAPPRRIIATALLPPFHGEDVRANRGIGMEYLSPEGRRYALAQWPARGGSLNRFPPMKAADAACVEAKIFRRSAPPDGIAWSTPNRIIMTLQADGAGDARTLQSEWRKLVRRGACR